MFAALRFLAVLAAFATGLARAGQTVVSISGDEFLINGMPTYAGQFWQGHKVQGLLMNARLVQATFDGAQHLSESWGRAFTLLFRECP